MADQRTIEIEHLKRENAELKEELARVKNELSEQYALLHHEHKELSDSINYAKRIQGAIQPPLETIKEMMPKSFVLYMPKDVVSGDFYFARKFPGGIVFAAVDCTGHGIPGALMSVVGFNYLDLAVNESITIPSEILSFLDAGVNEKLRQTGGESGVNDGMDLGLCSLLYPTDEEPITKLQYAGAYNPLYVLSPKSKLIDWVEHGEHEYSKELLPIMSNEEKTMNLFEIKADKFPIGVNLDGVTDIYTNHTLELEEGDIAYLFSDGYADQFGGPRDKKYKYKQMKQFLLSINKSTMEDQKQLLIDEFYRWQGDAEQVDDVIIFGVKI